MAIKKPNAQRKNTLICIGSLQSFGDLVQSKTEGSPYYYEPVKLKGQGGSPDSPKFNFMWAPDFLDPNFDISSLNSSSEFVYQKNIASLDGASILEALCGSPEEFERLQEGLVELGDYSAEAIHGFLSSFFSELGPVPVIYILKQESKKTGLLTAEGKPERQLTQYYEVESMYHATEKSLKALVKRIEGNAKRIEKETAAGRTPPVKTVFKFDPADFGFDVEIPQTEPAWTA